MIDNKLSQKIAFFHIFGLMLVIPIHISMKMDPAFSNYFVTPFRVFCHAFQPIYFGLAGYLFFQNIESDIIQKYKYKLKKRVNSLIVPYILWNILAFGLYLLLVHYDIKSYLVDSFQTLYASRNVLDLIFHVPVDEHLWFVQDLIVVSIISLPLYYLLNNKKWYVLLCLVALTMVVHQTKMASIASFAIGAYVGINNKELLQRTCKSKFLFAVFIIGTIIVIGIQLYHALPLNVLFMFAWVIALTLWMLYDMANMDKRLCKYKLGVRKYFFFCYLAHDPLLSIICNKLSAWSDFNFLISVILYLVVFVGIISTMVFLGFLLDKKLHRVFAVLTGGR